MVYLAVKNEEAMLFSSTSSLLKGISESSAISENIIVFAIHRFNNLLVINIFRLSG